jgi:CelD/BcsL family acetyltransferase involved in cellulose biosynthesis
MSYKQESPESCAASRAPLATLDVNHYVLDDGCRMTTSGTTEHRPSFLNPGIHRIAGLQDLEAALANGLFHAWRELVDRDPLASLFQAPGWCVPWYRCYCDRFDPCLILVVGSVGLVGLVPLAVDRETQKLVFASDTMADYRDIVALPGERELVVDALLREYITGCYSSPFDVGWLDPRSDTANLLTFMARKHGLHTFVRHQPCWRWFPPPPAKPSAQKFLNWYKRHGEVSFQVVTSVADWHQFKCEYYDQHSLRQLQAARGTTFSDARRTAFYDALFSEGEVECHVSAFRFNSRMLAGHFGYVWRNTLLLGPPSIHLEEEQRSPAVILFGWIIQNASRMGLAGFDLTIGESSFKARLGNECVQLTTVELHRGRGRHLARLARRQVMTTAKRVVTKVGGDTAWNRSTTHFSSFWRGLQASLAEEGVGTTVIRGARIARALFVDARRTDIYCLAPNPSVPPRHSEFFENFEMRDNCIEDLLRLRSTSFNAREARSSCARSYARARARSQSLHTLLVNGELAGWLYSEPAKALQPPHSSTSHATGSALVLSGFYAVPGFEKAQLFTSALSNFLRRPMPAPRETLVYLDASEKSLRDSVEGMGFRLTASDRRLRLLGRAVSTERFRKLRRTKGSHGTLRSPDGKHRD